MKKYGNRKFFTETPSGEDERKSGKFIEFVSITKIYY